MAGEPKLKWGHVSRCDDAVALFWWACRQAARTSEAIARLFGAKAQASVASSNPVCVRRAGFLKLSSPSQFIRLCREVLWATRWRLCQLFAGGTLKEMCFIVFLVRAAHFIEQIQPRGVTASSRFIHHPKRERAAPGKRPEHRLLLLLPAGVTPQKLFAT